MPALDSEGRQPAIHKDAAIYDLVLRQTIEWGHYRGSPPTREPKSRPSPIRAFYVLERAIPGVEDPYFNHDRIDDRQLGVPLSRELKESLTRSVADLAPIDFVPRLVDLIDLTSRKRILVKEERGFIALGTLTETEGNISVGVYFYAGGLWSRSNRHVPAGKGDNWRSIQYENLAVS